MPFLALMTVSPCRNNGCKSQCTVSPQGALVHAPAFCLANGIGRWADPCTQTRHRGRIGAERPLLMLDPGAPRGGGGGLTDGLFLVFVIDALGRPCVPSRAVEQVRG